MQSKLKSIIEKLTKIIDLQCESFSLLYNYLAYVALPIFKNCDLSIHRVEYAKNEVYGIEFE